MDVPTLLASGGLSALVSVVTATRVAARSERGRRIFAARADLRTRVDEKWRHARKIEIGDAKGPREPGDGKVHADDFVFAGEVLQVAEGLPWWQRWLVRRRCRKLTGRAFLDLAEVYAPDKSSIGGLMTPLIVWSSRQMRGAAEFKEQDVYGLVHAGLLQDAPARDVRRLRRNLGLLRRGL